jgi:hypothetical protein
LATLATFNKRGFSRTILQLCFRVPNTPRRAADIPWALAWAMLPLANAGRITLFRRNAGKLVWETAQNCGNRFALLRLTMTAICWKWRAIVSSKAA